MFLMPTYHTNFCACERYTLKVASYPSGQPEKP